MAGQTVKLTEQGYNRLARLKELLRKYYRESFSFEDTIHWLIVKSEIEIKKMAGELKLRDQDAEQARNPLKVKTILDDLYPEGSEK